MNEQMQPATHRLFKFCGSAEAVERVDHCLASRELNAAVKQ